MPCELLRRKGKASIPPSNEEQNRWRQNSSTNLCPPPLPLPANKQLSGHPRGPILYGPMREEVGSDWLGAPPQRLDSPAGRYTARGRRRAPRTHRVAGLRRSRGPGGPCAICTGAHAPKTFGREGRVGGEVTERLCLGWVCERVPRERSWFFPHKGPKLYSTLGELSRNLFIFPK